MRRRVQRGNPLGDASWCDEIFCRLGLESTLPPQGRPGVWEHRVVGLCSFAPNALPRHGLVFRGGQRGTDKVYLDNLRIRRADGSHTPIWTGGKDTRYRPIADSELFTGIRVRTVPSDQVK